LLEFGENMESSGKREWTHFVMRFQQVTGPLLAKAMEDSAFFVYNRLLCLNEVGGDPGRFGIPAADWSKAMQQRMASWPAAQNATATHDAKRGEDARMRLAVLSELPQPFAEALKALGSSARGRRQRVGSRLMPDRNEAYFLYQALLAHRPFADQDVAAFGERLKAYLVKALREAKEHSNWQSPDEQAEQAYLAYAGNLLDPDPAVAFPKAFSMLCQRVARVGLVNSLSQTLLKITAPGLPDFYQGTEFWDFSMVDPDNRRPVDFVLRHTTLTRLARAEAADRAALLAELVQQAEDGRIKLFLIWKGLAARRELAEVYRKGEFRPLEFAGGRQGMAFGFARTLGETTAVTLVPRFFAKAVGEEARFPLGAFWEDAGVTLAGAHPFVDAFTGRVFAAEGLIPLQDIFCDLPFALLVSQPPTVGPA
jgi:(1->4)-alpha-D-glucan 1-alpha-D-glucosylmutase